MSHNSCVYYLTLCPLWVHGIADISATYPVWGGTPLCAHPILNFRERLPLVFLVFLQGTFVWKEPVVLAFIWEKLSHVRRINDDQTVSGHCSVLQRSGHFLSTQQQLQRHFIVSIRLGSTYSNLDIHSLPVSLLHFLQNNTRHMIRDN